MSPLQMWMKKNGKIIQPYLEKGADYAGHLAGTAVNMAQNPLSTLSEGAEKIKPYLQSAIPKSKEEAMMASLLGIEAYGLGHTLHRDNEEEKLRKNYEG